MVTIRTKHHVSMKLNKGKGQLFFEHKYELVWADKEEDRIWETSNVKLSGIANGNQLKFERNFSNSCSRANNTLTEPEFLMTSTKAEGNCSGYKNCSSLDLGV